MIPRTNSRVNVMSPDDRKRAYWKDLFLASALVTAGLVISGLSLAELPIHGPQMAQATQPLQSTPGADTKPSAPAEPAATTGSGSRPSEIPPQPARPDAEAQKAGAAPALPPAPAEKTAAPIKEK